MRENYISYAVQTRREKIPDRIRYTFIRALMCDITLKVGTTMSSWARDKMKEDFYRCVATLMVLDWYSATHAFNHEEEVEIEPKYLTTGAIYHWWNRYNHLSPDDMVDSIWAEVE